MGPVIADIVDVLEDLGGRKLNDDPHRNKTVPIPDCLRADGNTLCQCDRAGLLVADGVRPGHFLGKFHMAPSERKVRRVEYASSTDANNAGELTAAGWAVRSTNKRRPSPSLIVQRQRRTVGLSRRAACPQTLDQLSCLTANSADD